MPKGVGLFYCLLLLSYNERAVEICREIYYITASDARSSVCFIPEYLMIEINTKAKPKPTIPMAMQAYEWVHKPEEESLIVGSIYKSRSSCLVTITDQLEVAGTIYFHGDMEPAPHSIEPPVTKVVFTQQGFYVGVGVAHLYPSGKPTAMRTIIGKATKLPFEAVWARYIGGEVLMYKIPAEGPAPQWHIFPQGMAKGFLEVYYTNNNNWVWKFS